MERSVRHEPRWHAAIATLIAMAFYVTLPPKLIVGPLWLMPVLILVVLVPLLVIAPRRRDETRTLRAMSIAVVALLNAFNIATVVTLFIQLLSEHHHKTFRGEDLLRAAVEIWLTNIIVYALWYWEIDGAGPDARMRRRSEDVLEHADFLFPQMQLERPYSGVLDWRPKFFDYVFLSFNTATALSPADAFALTPLAKLLMMGEAMTSLVALAGIAARAINILGT
jgi:hypothetical protein